MRIIFIYYIKQLLNYWKSLGFRVKVEIIVLLTIFYTFFTEKLGLLYRDLLAQPEITPLGLSSFNVHILVFFISISVPFVYFKLFPRQSGLRNLRVLPLNTTNSLALILIYIIKYELITFLIVGPVIIALSVTTGFIPVLYFFYIIIVSPLILVLLLQFLLGYKFSRLRILTMYFFTLLLYFIVHTLLYLNRLYYAISDVFLLTIVLIWLYRRLQPFSEIWDVPLSVLSLTEKTISKNRYRFNYCKVPVIFPPSIQPFFRREFLGHIRNKNYLRMKIFALILLILLLFLVPYNNSQMIAAIGFIFIWLHYAHQFNEKYTFSESKYFIKSAPVHYYQLWSAKFFNELIFIIPLVLICLIALIIFESDPELILLIFLALLIFALVTLFIITNIRMIFYDNPRMAGYAYHFLIIFAAVMIGNFYLVGPIVIFTLLIYIGFISYRQFSN